ncbi:MAG: GNAT family N-acetyltransferase [bacterium]
MKIRPFTIEDCPEVISLWSRAGLMVELAGRDTPEALGNQLEYFSETYLVAEEGSRIIGVVLGTHDGRKGWISRLAVNPEYRRQGVAETLIHEVERRWMNRGIHIFAALVMEDNPASRALFEKLGYLSDRSVMYFRKKNPPEV